MTKRIERAEFMSQNNWDSINILILLFTIVAALIALFAEIRNQRQGREEDKSNEATKEEIKELHKELELLKIRLEQVKE